MLSPISIRRYLLLAVAFVLISIPPQLAFAQEDEGPVPKTLQVLNADASAFPYVTVDFALSTKAGVLYSPIDWSQVVLSENDNAIDADYLNAAYINDVPLNVHIVVDTAANGEVALELAQTLVASTNLKDTVSVSTIGATLQPLPNETRSALQAGIENAEIATSDTQLALSAAFDLALQQLSPVDGARNVVLLISNNELETNPVSPPDIARSARSQNASGYILALEGGHSLSGLDIVATNARGGLVTNTTLGGLRQQSELLLASLRGAYRLQYVSGNATDDTLDIGIDYQLSDSFLQDSYVVPVSAPKIGLALPNVPADGVSGIFTFAAQTSGAAEIDFVEIYVDDQLVEVLHQAPFEIFVNTTQYGLGEHEFTAIARDMDGHYGRIDVPIEFVQTPPIDAYFDSSAYELGLNESVDLELIYDDAAQIEAVAFFVNDDLLQQFDAPPYRAQLTTDMLAGGHYTLTAVIKDAVGRETQVSSRIEFIDSVFQQRFVQLTIAVLGMLLSLLLGIWAYNLFSKRTKRLVHKRFALDIANQSNVKQRFAVSIKDVNDALRINTLLNGLPLQTIADLFPKTAPVQARPVQSVPAQQSILNDPQRQPQPVIRQSTPQAQPATAGLNLSDKMAGVTAVGQFAGEVARVLPSSWGAPLRQASQATYRARSNVSRAEQNQKRMKRLFGKTPRKPQKHNDLQNGTLTVAASGSVSTPVQQATAATVQAQISQTPTHPWTDYTDWLITPELAPGETIALTVALARKKATADDVYGLRVTSLPFSKTPLAEEELVSSFKTVLPGISLGRRLLPLLVALSAIFLFVLALRQFVYLW